MQQSGAAHQPYAVRGQSHRLGNAERRIRNAHRMTEGEVRLCIDDIGESLADLIDLSRLQFVLRAGIEVEDRLPRVLLTIAGSTVCP